MTDGLRRNLPVWLSAANIILLLGIIWNTSAWKASVDASLQQHREALATLSSRKIHPQADIRLVALERDMENRGRELSSLREDLWRRLDRIDDKIDRLYTGNGE